MFSWQELKNKKEASCSCRKTIRFYIEDERELCFCREWFFTHVGLPAFRLWGPAAPSHWRKRPCLWVSSLLEFCFYHCVFSFFMASCKTSFPWVSFCLLRASPDHARSRLGWAVPSGCPDGKNLTIAFSARGLILSSCFTTWACQDRVYPQKWIAYLLHNISRSIWITKGKVFCFFSYLS